MALFLIGTVLMSITIGAAKITHHQKQIKAGYRRRAFGQVIHLNTGKPIMPLVTIAGVIYAFLSVFG